MPGAAASEADKTELLEEAAVASAAAAAVSVAAGDAARTSEAQPKQQSCWKRKGLLLLRLLQFLWQCRVQLQAQQELGSQFLKSCTL